MLLWLLQPRVLTSVVVETERGVSPGSAVADRVKFSETTAGGELLHADDGWSIRWMQVTQQKLWQSSG